MGVVQVQMGVVQMGVVQLGSVQMGADLQTLVKTGQGKDEKYVLTYMLLGCYPAFYRRLQTNSSMEVIMIAELSSGNAQIVTSYSSLEGRKTENKFIGAGIDGKI